MYIINRWTINRKVNVLMLLFMAGSHGIVCAQQPETAFLKRSSVTWGAFISDTLRFSNPNVSLSIRQQFSQGKIHVTPAGIDQHVHPNELLSQQRLQEMFPGFMLFDTALFNSQTNDLLFVEQFIYVDNGKLRSHVSWISPVFNVITPVGTHLGTSYAFNAYYNKKERIRRSVRRKAIYLGQTTRTLTDPLPLMGMIKRWYNQSLPEALWSSISAGSTGIHLPGTMQKITCAAIDAGLYSDEKINIPLYDSTGNMSGSTSAIPAFEVRKLSEVAIVQDWFYSPSKQLMYNNITSLIFYAHKTHEGILEEKASPVLKVMYK